MNVGSVVDWHITPRRIKHRSSMTRTVRNVGVFMVSLNTCTEV
jgi:hypothetical protein